MSLFLQNPCSWQDSSDCPPPKPPEQNVHVDRFYDFSQASDTLTDSIFSIIVPLCLSFYVQSHIHLRLYLCVLSSIPEVSIHWALSVFWHIFQIPSGWDKILKWNLLRIFGILMPCSMKNFWSLNKTCVWVPFCLLLNAFLVLGLCRLCYMEHAIELISGTV